MKTIWNAVLGAALLAVSSTGPSAAAQDNPGVETLSEYPIPVQTARIAAPVEDVWDAFTTSDGYMGWAAPFAVIDLRVNGSIEASYAPDAVAGDPGNIIISIPAYIPERLLVLKTTQAPPEVATAEVLDRLVSIIEFDAIGPDETELRLTGVGYTPEDDQMREAFLQWNAWSLEQLRAYLAGDDE